MYTIKDIATLCLDNDVDFEVFNGENTYKQNRKAMLIQLSTPIRVDFGDKKHGERISRIHYASDHKLTVKTEELIQAIQRDETETKRWSTGTVTVGNFSRSNGNSVVLSGTVEQEAESVKLDGKFWNVFTVKTVHRALNTLTQEVVTLEPTFTPVRSTHPSVLGFKKGDTVNLDGYLIPGFGLELG